MSSQPRAHHFRRCIRRSDAQVRYLPSHILLLPCCRLEWVRAEGPLGTEEDVATPLARGWVMRFTKGSRAACHAAHTGRGILDAVVAVDLLAAVEGMSKELSLAQATKVTRAGSPVGDGRCRRVEAEARLDGCDHGVVGGAEEGVGCVRREDVARTGLHELEEVGALTIRSASPKELVPGDLGVEVAHGGPDGG